MESERLDICSLPLLSSSCKWWSSETVAVVTGGNKGIGLGIVKRLAEVGLTVVLTCRDAVRGVAAVESLREQGLARHLHFFQLDVSDPHSIQHFVSSFQNNFSALHLLVNNAGVSFNGIRENSVEHAEMVMRTNFYGAKLLTQALLPILIASSSSSSSSSPRILNISSRLASLNKVREAKIKAILNKEDVREEEIEALVRMFLDGVRDGGWESQGWPRIWTDYAVSKLALNAYSKLLANRYRGKGLAVNCFCPGYTQTSMTAGTGTHSAQAAADAAVRLALLPPNNLPTGRFFIGYNFASAANLPNAKL